ncbi:MAG: ubiquitin-like domain-containing protein [Clostridiales bacterium]|nr:ubiquitin-like domain-containing protein [Clostridiales bacterium]
MKKKILLLVITVLAVLLTACAKKVTVAITDFNVTTEIEAKVGQTIEQVLSDAQIELGEKDETVPARDEKLAEETTEIVIHRYAKLTVKDNGEETEIETWKGETIADVLKGAGITLGDKDMVIPAAEEKVAGDQTEVVIQRYAAVAITDLGEKKEYDKIKGLTIQEVLDQENIVLGEKDEIEPAADTVLSEDMTEVQIRRYAKVTIKHEDEEIQVELVGGTVADALKEAGIELGEKEEADEAPDTFLVDGMVITISREKTVKLKMDGKSTEITTKAVFVSDFLEEQKITLGPDDEMNKKPEDRIKDGMKLTVHRVEYKEEKVTETIDYGTIEQYSDSMDVGTSTIEQYGSEGEKEVTYKVKYVDGKEDSREAIKEEVTKEPVDEIITYGTYEAPASSGRTETGRTAVYDCDGSGHGYYEIYYSDGSVEYETF